MLRSNIETFLILLLKLLGIDFLSHLGKVYCAFLLDVVFEVEISVLAFVHAMTLSIILTVLARHFTRFILLGEICACIIFTRFNIFLFMEPLLLFNLVIVVIASNGLVGR